MKKDTKKHDWTKELIQTMGKGKEDHEAQVNIHAKMN